MNLGLGEIYDPGLIPIKVKKKEAHEGVEPTIPSFTPNVQPTLPKWTALQLKRPGKGEEAQGTIGQDDSALNGVNGESASTAEAGSSSTQSSRWAKPQWSAPLPDIKSEERGKIFGLGEEQTDVTEDISAAQGPGVKAEPDIIKTEDDRALQPDTSNTSTGSLFKKRKTPAGSARGRRPI